MPSTYAISSGHALTSQAGADVLAAGGTAVDACIAAALMAGVTEPILASLLGGGFFTIAPAQAKTVCLDAFVQTPKRKSAPGDIDFRAIEANFGETTQVFQMGAGSIATPGLVLGLFEAHASFGRIPMEELAAPAVRAARSGVVTGAFPARIFEIVGAIYEAEPCARKIYCPTGELPKEGEVLHNPAMADVMEVMAVEGRRFVQEGEVAAAVLSLEGSHLSRTDFKDYTLRWREPLHVTRGGYDIALNPPPSLGGTQIALALGALPVNPTPSDIARMFELIAKARREGQNLLCPELQASMHKVLANHSPASRGTTHISAVDSFGNGAALTLSNGEGCGLIAPGTGLMPNNMLGEEDLVPDGWHSWQPDTRLASGMCPIAMRSPDGGMTLLGSGGSNRIRTALAQTLLNVIDRGMDLETAVSAPRLHAEGAPARVDFEDWISEEHREGLLNTYPEAHGWKTSSMFFGGVHAARRTAKGDIQAAGDPRRDGVAITG